MTAQPLAFFLFVSVMLTFGTTAIAQRTDEMPAFELSSLVFAHNGKIPVKYTCSGSDINPPLSIKNIPEGTKSMALTVHDPDAISGTWVHWVVYNIKPDTREIPENSKPGTEALNDFGNFYYGGPCPPDEKEHSYVFTLYALNEYLVDINEGATKDTLEKAIQSKILAKTVLVGKYQNLRWQK